MVLPTIKTFSDDYDSIYKQVENIFKEYNICQWEKNADGSFSCILNRINTQKNNSKIIETDGCCISICKQPKDFNDKAIKKSQHTSLKGCIVKSLKCKLHICKYLRETNDLNIKEAITKIDLLINLFRLKYDVIWESIPYGSSKKTWLDFYRMYRNIFL